MAEAVLDTKFFKDRLASFSPFISEDVAQAAQSIKEAASKLNQKDNVAISQLEICDPRVIEFARYLAS